MRSIEKINSISNVAAGNSVSLKLQVGRTYDRVHFKYSGVTASEIENVRLELNGRLLTEYRTLQQLIDENKYYQRKIKAGFVTWHFGRHELESVKSAALVERRFFNLGTSGLSTVEIKFDIKGTATNPKIEAFAEKSDSTAPGWLTKRRSFMMNLNAGLTEIADLPKPVGAHIAAIHIHAAGVEGVEYLIDNVKWRDAIDKELHNHILEQSNRTPKIDVHHIDFMLEGDMWSSVKLTDTIQDMRLRVNASAQTQAEVVIEYLDQYSPVGF